MMEDIGLALLFAALGGLFGGSLVEYVVSRSLMALNTMFITIFVGVAVYILAV